MRRVLGGILPLAMAGGALFAMAPTASAAPAAKALPQAASCPSYGPGSCTGKVTVTVQTPNGHIITITISANGYLCGERVNVTLSNPNHNIATFTAKCPQGSAAAVNSTPSPYPGGFSGSIVLPNGYAAGPHTLTALGSQSGVIATTTVNLPTSSGYVQPCTASISSSHTTGVVLAAAYLSAQCKTALPATAGGPPSSGSNNAIASVGTASPQRASQLPFTGFNAATAAASGAILVGAGGALVMVSRRRRRSAWQ